MNDSPLKLVIVGHVDHGKSTLIGRLLYDTDSLPVGRMEEIRKASRELGRKTEFAYLLDYLEEERRQNITIDTTQVFFKTKTRGYVIIDAPGHVEFVKNMVTGASQADSAVIIIDANCGIQEQTRRHAYLLSVLGIPKVTVVFNKMDLVDFSQAKYKALKKQAENLLNKLKGITVNGYIPISALMGDNVIKKTKKAPWYKGPALLESLDASQNKLRNDSRSLIMPVQDIYLFDDNRIVVGTIARGRVRKNDTIKVLPSGRRTLVNSIEKFGEKANTAEAQESIGLTLKDRPFVERGDVICAPAQEPRIASEFSAVVFWMSNLPLKKHERIVLRCATQESPCSIEKISKRIDSSTFKVIEEDVGRLLDLEVGEVTIKTKKTLVLETFKAVREIGRFVLLRQEETVAGGIIKAIS